MQVAKYRELCPPGTEDSQIVRLLEQHKGDAHRIENAISELWEDYRGGGQDDWATVEKKGKKQQPPPSRGHYSSQQSYNNDSPVDQSGLGSSDRFAGRGGRGAGRGRGSFASRGGRGGGRGRGGRGGIPRSESREQNGDSPEEPTEDSDAADGVQSSETLPESDTTASKKSGPKSTKPAQTAVAPPPVGPILTGAWTKKPNLAGLVAKPKPIEPAATPKPVVEKPTPAPAAKSPSPKKKVEQKSPQKTRPSEPVVNEPAEKIVSPKKVAETKVEKKIESPRLSGWGSLDVSTSGIGEWPSSTTTESKTSTTPNAWARGSPLLTPVAVAASSESASALPTVVPGSPKDIQIPRAEARSAVSSSTSPKQYLKMGKWDSAATTNLSLQFGSFSLNGVEHTESTSPRGWSSTTTTTTTSTNGSKTVSKTETQSAWSKVASPKEKTALSPPRKLEPEAGARKGPTTSAPPGLSVDSGRVTPKSSQSPRTFAPSAPSPASLPKPDDVKRNTPTRGQGHFQSQSATQGQTASKIGSGSGYATEFGSKSSGLYQASYNQYAMDLGSRATASATAGNIAQSQVASSSSTPKNAGGRNAGSSGVGAVGSTQSPSHGAQQSAQLQFQQSQQQGQQQPSKQHGQQSQQQQNQQAHGQSQQQSVPQHHPQGYHPHYAPPPPPGMALPYNPYNYASYYQGYGYYQNPQVRCLT